MDIVETIKFHYKQGNINWPMGIYVTLMHVYALVGIVMLPFVTYKTLFLAFILWPISGLGITAGAHRLWSHRSYKAHPIVRWFLMLCNSIANQGSIYHWSRDHRVHHKASETDADPHDARRGFFFAHCGWLFVKKHPAVIACGKQLDFSDLEEDPAVMFQKVLDPWFALFMCFVFPGLMAMAFCEDTFWHGFWVAGALRYVFVLNATWLVNSAAHLYGDHPYDASINPAENPLVSLLAIGEGWHNWHHKYPFDYATSELGIFDQFNPTKLFIDGLAKVGLVWDRRRATGAWNKKKVMLAAKEKAN